MKRTFNFIKLLENIESLLTEKITRIFAGRQFSWGSDLTEVLSLLDNLYQQYPEQIQQIDLFNVILHQLLVGMERQDVYYFADRLWLLRRIIRQLMGKEVLGYRVDLKLPIESEVQFGSFFAPREEASIWVDNYYDEKSDVFIIIGTGRSHYHCEVAKRLRLNQKLFIIEWDGQQFERFSREYGSELESPNITICLKTGTDSVKREIARLIDLFISCRICFSFVPPYYFVKYKETREIENSVSQFIRTNLVIANTVDLCALTWPINYFRNFELMVAKGIPFSSFQGKFTDVPAVVVASGPSLDKNVELLSEVTDKAVIIAAGSSIEALYKIRDIKPHFVASFDGNEGNYPHFKGLRTGDLRLIFSGDIYPRIIEEFEGTLIPTEIANKPSYSLYKKFGAPSLGEAFIGPSVANFALDLAVRLGCNPIVIIGQDLSVSDGKTHALGHFQRMENIDMNGYFKVKGNVEEYVYTNPSWSTMLKAFEIQLKIYVKGGKRIINATEGGAYIEGTEVMTFREAIDAIMQENYEIEAKIVDIVNSYKKEKVDVEIVKKKIIENAQKLRSNILRSIKVANDLVIGFEDSERVDRKKKRIIAYLKKQEEALLEHPIYQFIIRDVISYQILYYERHYRRMAEENPRKVEKWVAEYQKKLFESSLKALDAFLDYIA